MNARLSAAQEAVKGAQDSLRAKREQRDELVVRAVDGGMSQRAVAKTLEIAVSRVSAILLDAGGE
jgi:DNA invertase Pin-like site-specific DNA recombinase